jgi:N-acylneuraminate cytidylyltransferase
MPGMTCDEANMQRQDFPEVYIPNGYVDVLRTDFIIKTDLLHGDKMLAYKTDEIPDIDTELDLKKISLYDNLSENIKTLRNYLETQTGCR